jgi:hypothetical protein
MTREQKQALAMGLLQAAANMLENAEDPFSGINDTIRSIPADERAEQVALWLDKLPTGGGWDCRLPDPMDVREQRKER